VTYTVIDFCSGAGGAAMGYHQAGLNVVGIDINPMPRFPFKFIQADAITFLDDIISGKNDIHFDAIHASPPCQRFSQLSNCRPGLKETYPDPYRAYP
jgi:DNA (cytosine-5)-methyltransferase 1